MSTRYLVWFWGEVRAWSVAVGVVVVSVLGHGVGPEPVASAFTQGALLLLPLALAAGLVLWLKGKLFPAILTLACAGALAFLVLPRTGAGALQWAAPQAPVPEAPTAAKTKGEKDSQASPKRGQLRLTTLNVWGGNKDFAAVDAFLAAGDFDVVVLQECGRLCAEGRDKRLAKAGYYSMKLDAKRLAVFSKRPLRQPEASEDPPYLAAEAELSPGRFVKILTTHLERPWPFTDAATHTKQVEALFALAKKETTRPFVMAGDFNAAPWTPAVRAAAQAAGLDEARMPALPPGTWPERLPPWGLPVPLPLVPLDHVYLKNGVDFVSWSVGTPVGSDHRPVVVTLSIPD